MNKALGTQPLRLRGMYLGSRGTDVWMRGCPSDLETSEALVSVLSPLSRLPR